MSPITHFIIGWSVATSTDLRLKERALITIAGIAPDIDGAGLIYDFLAPHQDIPYKWAWNGQWELTA